MVRVVEDMSHDKKVEMYKAIDKDALIEMLIEANNMIDKLVPKNVIHDKSIGNDISKICRNEP